MEVWSETNYLHGTNFLKMISSRKEKLQNNVKVKKNTTLKKFKAKYYQKFTEKIKSLQYNYNLSKLFNTRK